MRTSLIGFALELPDGLGQDSALFSKMSKSKSNSNRWALLLPLLAAAAGFAGGYFSRQKPEPLPTPPPEVERFLDRYFEVWSADDLEGYRACFHPDGIIQFLQPNGTIATSGVKAFVEGQRTARTLDPGMVEVPLWKRISVEGPVSRATVAWRLTKKSGTTQSGMNYFTLVQTQSGWAILNLTFTGSEDG